METGQKDKWYRPKEFLLAKSGMILASKNILNKIWIHKYIWYTWMNDEWMDREERKTH